MEQLKQIIEAAFERRSEITPRNADAQLKEAVDSVITKLDNGTLRVAEKIDGEWFTHQWLKKAVLPITTTKCRQNLPTTTAAISVKAVSALCHLLPLVVAHTSPKTSC